MSYSAGSVRLRPRGFTLIEVLIAMLIFSWIGLGAYQILDQVTRARDMSLRQSEQLSTMQRVAWRLSQDYRQARQRSVLDELGDRQDWLVPESEEYLIEFTRAGWSNPLQWPRSELQRVAYTIDYHPEHEQSDSPFYNDERLYLLRYYWQVLDRTLETEPRVQALLADVADFRTRYWDSQNEEWSDNPLGTGTGNNGPDMPRAFEVSILLENEQMLNFIFRAK